MSQPMDRSCSLPPRGEVDEEAGEFWAENITLLPQQRRNLSAYERNCVYLNTGGKGFLDCSFASGADLDSDSRSVITADFNRDGRADLLVGSVGGGPLRLFLNEYRGGNSLNIQLVGVRSNRSGIGARVIAEIDGRQLVRDVFPANGFMGSAPAELLLGTGGADQIKRLTVRWPTGKTQTFENLPAIGQIQVTEGAETVTVIRDSWE